MGRVGVAILEIVNVFGFSYLFGVSKVSTVTGMGRVGVAILEIVIVFWLLMSFWRVKSVNSHGDGAGRGRHPRNCDRFLASHIYLACPKKSTVTGMGRVGVAILEIVIVFGFSSLFGVSKVSTVTGMGRVGVAILEIVIVFGFSCLLGMSKVSTVTGKRRAPPKRQKPKNREKNQKYREKTTWLPCEASSGVEQLALYT